MVDIHKEVRSMLDDVLHLGGRARTFGDDTPLLGSIPELDSMAVVAIISAIEERFSCAVDDDEIDGAVFATVGTLTHFIIGKVAVIG